MITQKQILEWVDSATSMFKQFMPEVGNIPEIHIATDRIILKTRAELVKRLKSHQENISEEYSSIMEMIHGELGDAILISQTKLQELEVNNLAFHYFNLFYWHEMGHFYAIKNEKTNMHRFFDQELNPESIKQEGYWFWAEFIAQSIAYRVDELNCSINNAACYHPEQIVWEPDVWGPITERLLNYLEMAFFYYGYTVDEASLAMFFSTILMDDLTKRYIVSAEKGDLLIYDNGLRKTEPGEVEPTCISDAVEIFQDTLWKMHEILMAQMQKEDFWLIDEDWLERIGQCVVDLNSKKSVLLSKRNTEEI